MMRDSDQTTDMLDRIRQMCHPKLSDYHEAVRLLPAHLCRIVALGMFSPFALAGILWAVLGWHHAVIGFVMSMIVFLIFARECFWPIWKAAAVGLAMKRMMNVHEEGWKDETT